MMKGKLIKGLYYTLISSLILGNISPVLAKTSVASIDETIDIKESGSSETSVYAELGKEFTITVPKSLTLSGQTKSGTYTVSVSGDIAGTDKINVIPDETFTLNSSGLDSITASINQDKTSWIYSEITTDSAVVGNGIINASNLSAGKWNGTFNFNINLKGSGITVEAKDENGNDLNASASEITGTKKDTLLNSLVDTGLINSTDEVDALIEVESDEFDGIADTTFNVSSIANEGEKIAILHFNEETNEWEYVSTETVDSEGKINADFSSYSPVAFVKITENGNFENITLEPGLYNANGVMLCTWEESGIDVEKDYTSSTYATATTSGYYVLTNNYPTATQIVLPDEITSIGNYAFYDCTKLKNITLSSGITSIGENAFRDCRSLIEVLIPSNVNSIGNTAFFQCYSLSKVVISEGIKHIGQQSFAACNNFTNINIPLSIESLGYGAFMGNNKLTSVTYNKTIYTNITKLITDLENNGVIVNKYGIFDNTGLIN